MKIIMEVNIYNNLSDQEYLVARAKEALKCDPATAKSWLITAKTLYPNNFDVQFEAYHIEKEANNVKEAAKYFSELLSNFQQQPELWKEVERVTFSLRSDCENKDSEMQFLSEMFNHISLEVQHQLLLMTADHCDDTMEHCRLLLLLLKQFPQSIITHGPSLIDTLLSAEKHSHASNHPVNCYRKLLVCELLPLLNDADSIELPSKLLFRLLHKAIEFYLYAILNNSVQLEQPLAFGRTTAVTHEPWVKLFQILHMIGRHLGWDPYLTLIGNTWNKESYWQKILSFCETHKTSNMDEHMLTKQLLYCLTILFLNCLHEYMQSLWTETTPGQVRIHYVLVEAFVDANLPLPSISDSKSKRRKPDANSPHLTVANKPFPNQIVVNFHMASNCWDLLHSTETLQREFLKLSGHLKLDALLVEFRIDYALYKGAQEDALLPLQQMQPIAEQTYTLVRNIRLMCIYFSKKNYTACFEHLLLVMSSMPSTGADRQFSSQLTTGGQTRHLHYLPLTQSAILQYCVRILIHIIHEFQENLTKQSNSYNELGLGILLTLIQLDWPQQEDLLPPIMEQIRQRGVFHYPLFQTYIVNVDILEEIMYLRSEQGGHIALDIFVTPQSQIGMRRIGTRGADKGVKEDFKQAMKRQLSKHLDSIENLIVQFITQERIHILQTLM